jgi:hypothetical protein
VPLHHFFPVVRKNSIRALLGVNVSESRPWEAEVDKMNKTFGAGIPEDNTKRIILYLQAHYTAENRKQ